MGTLYIVATPIGNLEDVTLRALRVLKEVDIILCEDTRMTKRLLDRHAIANKQLTTYNEQQSGISHKKVLEFLKSGRNIALVSDAGTPAISDPGSELVAQIMEQLPDVEIIAIPGASALTAALSASGLPASEFLFLGFLPHKKGRETLFKEIANSKRTVVFYESPHRIERTLVSLAEILGEREVVIARELTKMHEEILHGSATEILEKMAQNKNKIRGEFVVVVAPHP